MKLSQRTEYALRALVELGRREAERPTPCRAVAEAQNIPHRFCEQVMADLRDAGLIESHRGAAGGATLARDPASVTVADVVDAIEGPVIAQATLDPFDPESRDKAHSSVQELWLELQIVIRERLASVTLAELIGRQAELDSSSALAFQI